MEKRMKPIILPSSFHEDADAKLEWTGERFVPWVDDPIINYEHLHRYAFAKEIVENKIVLDMACGEGYGSAMLSETAACVTGIDIDEITINHASKKYQKDNLKFLKGSITDVPIRENELFDVIVCFEALEHITQHAQLMKEIKRLLKKDGILIISTPNKKLYSDVPNYKNPFHLKELYIDEFQNLLSEHFQDVVLFGQKIFPASNLFPMGRNLKPLQSFAIKKGEEAFEFVSHREKPARYFIAIATDNSAAMEKIGGESYMVDISSSLSKHSNTNGVKTASQSGMAEQMYQTVQNFVRLGKNDEAIGILEKIIARFPEFASAYNDLGVLYYKIGNKKKVLFHYQRAVQLNPENLTFLKNLADFYYIELGQFEEAIQVYLKVLKKNSDDIDSLLALGQICTKLNSFEKAKSFYKKVLTLDPQNTQAREYMDSHPEQVSADLIANSGQETQYSWYTLKKREIPSYKTTIPGLVSIVIPVFNKLSYTQKCLETLQKNTPADRYEMIIVDNSSSDGTHEFLESLGNKVHVITNMTNIGFTKACNQGAQIAKGEYILFLNNDTEPQPGWLNSMLELIQSDRNIGIVGSKLVYPDGRLQEAGGIIFSDGSGWNFGRFDDPTKPLYNYVREVDYVSGASFLIRTSILKQINYFDEQYSPGYYEDTDLCFGVRAIGYKVMYCPFSVVVHHEGVSSGTDLSQGMKKYQIINRGKFVQKWKEQLSQQCVPSPKNVFKASERNVQGNILIIDPFLPMFDRASGSLRLFTIISLLRKQGYHITFIARNGQGQDAYATVLRKMGVEVYATDPDVLRKMRFSVSARKINLNEIFSTRQYEYAYLSFYNIALQYLFAVRILSPQSKVLIDTVDIHFIREMRQAELSSDRKLLERSKVTKEDELFIYSKADAVITVTEQDWDYIKDALPGKPHFVIPNIHTVSEEVVNADGRSGLLFVGNFNHPPNADAVEFFIKDVFPLVRKKLPDITLTIVGNNPPKNILKLAGQNVIVTGYVPSTEPYLQKARVSVAPLRYGAGMKGKIGEAMAHGLPVVTTSIGSEGMGIVHEDTAFIADDPKEFARHVVRLCSDDELWIAVSEKSRQFINEHFSPEKVATQLANMINALAKIPPLELTEEERKSLNVSGRDVQKDVVSIIILTFNQLKYTRECVESIRKHTPEPHEIIFVDNGSTDGTVKWLKKLLKETPNYKLIENHKNLGFPKGCNQGVNASSGESILLLNNDVVVTNGWLSGMLECLNSAPDVGIVGPMTNNISGNQKVEDTGYQSMADLNVFAQSFRERNRHRRIPMRRIVGFCMLFKRELVEKIGLLDETFGTGNFEDDDFCLRAALEGYRNFIAGDIFIHHYGSRSFRGNRIDYSSAMTGNRKIFNEKWSGIEKKSSLGEKALVLSALEDADTWNQKGKLDVAAGMFLEGIRHAPTEKRLYYALSEMLIDAKQFKDAYEILKEMSFDESDLRRLELIGYCAEGMERYNEAEGYAGRALSLNPASAPALNLKGVLAHKKGENDKAQEFFQNAIKADPGFGEPYTNSGVLKWAAGQREEALDLIERGCILSPTVSDIVTIYHSAISTLARFEQAEKVFREAQTIYPLNRRIAFLLIDTLIQQGKNDIAMKEIEKAMVAFGIDEGILSAALNIRETLGPRKIEGQQCSRATLSLCMIVKNEEAFIAQCLMSVAPMIDEMIIVDTGSTDRTKAIAQAFGAQVYDFQWTYNFAEARNFSLAQAHGDWVLVLDADEVISSRDHAALTELIKKKKPVGYSFTTRNYTGNVNTEGWVPNDGNYHTEEAADGWFPSQKVRLFPGDPRIRFENHVHELVEPSLRKEEIEIEKCRIPVHHYGRLDHKKDSVKEEAYYELGKAKLQEKGDDVKALSELAVAAGIVGKYEEAIELWQRAIAIKPDFVKAFVNLGHVYLQLQRYEDALAVSKRAVELAPDQKEAVLNYATSEVHAGNVKKAISVLEHLLNKIPEYPPAIGVLAAAYCIEDEKEKGLAYIEKIKKLGFNCPEFLYKHARSLTSAGRSHYAIRLLEAAVESKHVNDDITLLLSELRSGNGCERLA